MTIDDLVGAFTQFCSEIHVKEGSGYVLHSRLFCVTGMLLFVKLNEALIIRLNEVN